VIASSDNKYVFRRCGITVLLATKFPIPWRKVMCANCILSPKFRSPNSLFPKGNSSSRVMSFSRRCSVYHPNVVFKESDYYVITFCLRYRSKSSFFHGSLETQTTPYHSLSTSPKNTTLRHCHTRCLAVRLAMQDRLIVEIQLTAWSLIGSSPLHLQGICVCINMCSICKIRMNMCCKCK